MPPVAPDLLSLPRRTSPATFYEMGVFSRVKEGVRYILTSELPRSSTTSVDSVDRPRQNRRKTSNSTEIPKWEKDELERLEEIRGRGGNKIWEDDRSEDRGRRRSTEDTLRGRHRRHSSGAREKEFHKKANRPRKRRRKSWHPKKPVHENNVEEPKTQAFPSADNDFWKSIKEIGGDTASVPNLREYTKEQRAVWVEDDKKQREKERVRQEERRSARKGNEMKKNHDRKALQAKEGEENNERRARYHEWKCEKRKAEERRGLEKEIKEIDSRDRDVRSLEHSEHEQKSADKFGRVKVESEAKEREDRHEERGPERKREVEKTEKKRQEEEEKERQQYHQQQAPNTKAVDKEQDKRRVEVQDQKEKYLKDIEAKKRPEKENEEKLARQKAETEKAKKETQQEKAKVENEARQKREAQETLAKQRRKLQQEQEENSRQQLLQVPTNKNLKPMNIDLGNMDRTYIEGFHQQQPTTTKATPPQIPSPLSEKNLKAHTTVDGSDGSDLGNMDRTYIEGFYGCGDCIGCRKYQNCVNKEWLKTREKGIAKNNVARTNGKVLPGDLGGVVVDEGEGKGSVLKLGWMDRTFIEGFGGV